MTAIMTMALLTVALLFLMTAVVTALVLVTRVGCGIWRR
jgi:hypothetical protein